MPTSDKFRTCQDMFNRILSAQTGAIDTKFREHIGPASIIVGGIMGTTAVPIIMGLSAVVAARQARRERVFEEEFESRQSLHRSKSMNMKGATPISPRFKDSATRATNSASFDGRRPNSSRAPTLPISLQQSSSVTHLSNKHSGLMSLSQPNLQPPSPHRPSHLRPVSPADFTDENITRTLQTHYYSTQTQFLQCLQDISLRLRLVPKAARQSALRIELAGLDKWLPADVCLANLCRTNDVHDRVVQVVESDCTILNSAERVDPSKFKLTSGALFIVGGNFEGGFNVFSSQTSKSETFSGYHEFKSIITTIRSQHHDQRENFAWSMETWIISNK